MKIRQLVSGIASGYVAKGVQFLASIALVPFYLRDDILGLKGYGLAFTLLAATQFLTLFTDGLRLSFTRSVAQAISGADPDCTPGEAVGSGTKVLLAICILLGSGLALFASPVLGVLGIESTGDTRCALWLAAALFCIENGFQLLRAPLLTRGAISFVNLWLAIEALARAIAMYLLLSAFGGSLTLYFAIYLVFTTLRQLAFYIRLRTAWPGDLRGALRAPLARALPSARYSLTVSLQWGVNVLVSRSPIVLANRFLGPDISGLVAIVVNTIRGYFQQMLFSVLQPILVPVGSLVDPRRLTDSARRVLFDLEAIYAVGLAGVIFSASSVMPLLLRLWLGEDYVVLALPAQLVLAGSAVELASTVRRSLLLGQGFLLPMAVRFALAGAVALALCTASVVGWESWQALLATLAAFLAVGNAWATGAGFQRAFPDARGPHLGRVALYLLISASASIALSRVTADRGLAGALLALVANGVFTLSAAQLMLLPLRRGYETLVKLFRSADRNLFGAPESGSA